VIVRDATPGDVQEVARVVAAVAPEGSLAAAPVDVAERAERFRRMVESDGSASLCGAHKLWLETWTDNARAIAFYAAIGFEVEGLKRDHYRRRDGRCAARC
jgi:hypothetical protein